MPIGHLYVRASSPVPPGTGLGNGMPPQEAGDLKFSKSIRNRRGLSDGFLPRPRKGGQPHLLHGQSSETIRGPFLPSALCSRNDVRDISSKEQSSPRPVTWPWAPCLPPAGLRAGPGPNL